MGRYLMRIDIVLGDIHHAIYRQLIFLLAAKHREVIDI